MSELTDAMHEAVASLPTDRPARRDDVDVQLLDLDALPPIRHRPYQAATMGDLLAERGGDAWRQAWGVVAETVRLVLLFWAAAIGVAFVDAISDQGLSGPSMLWSSLGVTAALRALLAIRTPELGASRR